MATIKKTPIWLVWQADLAERGDYNPTAVSLHAVDTSQAIARTHLRGVLRESKDAGRRTRGWIEKRETNHCYGYRKVQ